MSFPFRRLIATAWNATVNFLYPARCHACGESLFGCRNIFLCPSCHNRIHWLGAECCHYCSAPPNESFTSKQEKHSHNCWRCRGVRWKFSRAIAAASYEGVARELAIALKFKSRKRLAKPMGELMACRFQSLKTVPFDAVVPTPLCHKRLLERGYNQAELLAHSAAKKLGIPLMTEALIRTKTTVPQLGKNNEERRKFPTDAFKAPYKIPPLRMILVDDVMTTGATASAATGALLDAGASLV